MARLGGAAAPSEKGRALSGFYGTHRLIRVT